MARISLDRKWAFKLDPKNIGLTEAWYSNSELLLKDASEISVPACWEEFEQDYQGVGWYQTEVEIPESHRGEICRITFQASNYRTQVWVNGAHVGTNDGGYTPFAFEIQAHLKFGNEATNTLTVRVISPIVTENIRVDDLGPNEMPHWRGGLTAGIWQSLALEFTKDLWIESAFYRPDLKNSAFNLEASIEVKDSLKSPTTAHLCLIDSDGNFAHESHHSLDLCAGTHTLAFELPLENPILWDCDHPHLYTATLTLKNETTSLAQSIEQIGLREFTYQDHTFYLNGEPFYLRGGFWEGVYAKHQSYPEDRAIIRKEIKLAKAAGLNLLRPWRRPVPPMILEEADAAGMLIIASPAVECMSCWPQITDATPQRIEHEIKALVLRDRNHPSIIWWEMFNEVTRQELADLITPMSLMTRALDPTRLILDESGGWASGAHFYLPNSKEPTDLSEVHSYVRAPVSEKNFAIYQNLGNDATTEGNTKVEAGIGIFMSEFGYGGLPEIEANCQRFQAEGNPKLPAYRHLHSLKKALKQALKDCKIENSFPEIDSFCRASQAIQARGNRRQLEALLANPNINGYCIHAFTDGDWILGAGLIDNWQRPKAVYHAIADANHNHQLLAFPKQRNRFLGQNAHLRVVWKNTTESIPTTLTLSAHQNTQRIESPDWQPNATQLECTVEVPASLLQTGINTLNLEALTNEGRVTETYTTELFVTETTQGDPDLHLVLYDPYNELSDWLNSNGFSVTSLKDWHRTNDSKQALFIFVPEDVAHDSDLPLVASALQHVHSGLGNACFLEAPAQIESPKMLESYDSRKNSDFKNNKLVKEKIFPFKLKTRSSFAFWESSMHVAKNHPIFDGLPSDCVMDEPYHEVIPADSFYGIEADETPSQTITWFRPEDDEKVNKRTFLGGEALWHGTNLALKKYGSGHILLSTFILRRKITTDPVAAKLFSNLIHYCAHYTHAQDSLLAHTESEAPSH